MKTQEFLFFTFLFVVAICSTISLSAQQAKAEETDTSPLDAETMDARVLILNTVTFSPTGAEYNINNAEGTLSWFPRETWLQQVTSFTTNPKAAVSTNGVIYSWENPQKTETIELTSTIHTRNAIIPVRERVAFPLNDISDEAAEYLGDEEIIDQTPEIRSLAQKLAMGKTDAYEVVYSLADWTTRNVNYSLASLGQPAIQRSSQVLQSRYGKCDEMTSLFISLNRALGIPARFVAGYSYSNAQQFRAGWGGHGWAEVWLPNQGWIPFDVTYGEYGYLDASHVTLKIAPDAKETSIDYSARGNDFTLHTEPLDITITPTALTERTSDSIGIVLEAPHTLVDFGSTVLILAQVTNKRDYYVSTRLDLAKTTSTEQLAATYQNILLRPHETKTVPFLVRIDQGLQRGYYYDFPFRVYSRLGPSATITITVRDGAPFYDSSAFDGEMAQYTAQEESTGAYTVTCDRGNTAYTNNPVEHTCTVSGQKTSVPTTLRVCDTKNTTPCTLVMVTPTATAEGSFTLTTTDGKAGVNTRTYTASDVDNLRQNARFFVTSHSEQPTEITAIISASSAMSTDDHATIRINLSALGARPHNVSASVRVQHAYGVQEVDDLDRPTTMLFTIPGRSLRKGDNIINSTITYVDELGTPGTSTVLGNVRLEHAGFIDSIAFLLEDSGYWIADLFS